MKILLAAAIYPPDPGGPATHAKRLFEALGSESLEAKVVVFSTYHHLPPLVRHIAYLFALLRNVSGCDVIYAYDARSTGGPAYLVSLLTRKPLVLRIGGDVVWEKATECGALALSMSEFYKEGMHQGLLFWGVRRVMQHAKKIIVTTPLLADAYKRYYGIKEEMLLTLANPLPFRPSESSSKKLNFCAGNNSRVAREQFLTTSEVELLAFGRSEEKALVFASRLVAYKNLDLLIDAFASVYEEIAPAKLYLLGKGPEEVGLREQVDRLGLKDKVIFGYRNRTDVDELLSRVWGTIAPALTEFNPNYVLEGLAHKKPFLLSREQGLFEDPPLELLFDPKDKKELERKLVWFFSEEGYKQAQNLIERIPCQQSWEENTGNQIDILKSVASLNARC